MDRRTAVQSLMAAIVSAMNPEQKTTPQGKPNWVYTLPNHETAPGILKVYLNWTDITVIRGGESVTIDQDELFLALKGDGK